MKKKNNIDMKKYYDERMMQLGKDQKSFAIGLAVLFGLILLVSLILTYFK